MSLYKCASCDNLKDSDYHPPEEYKGNLICDDCATEILMQESWAIHQAEEDRQEDINR